MEVSALCETYSSSRLAKESRPAIEAIRLDWRERILRFVRAEIFCGVWLAGVTVVYVFGPVGTWSWVILFLPSQSSSRLVSVSSFSISYLLISTTTHCRLAGAR